MTESWKAKNWYTVVAPDFLKNVEVATITGSSDEEMINRIIEIPLKDITNDLSHIYTNIRLRVFQVKEKKAFTKFIGHEIAKEYINSQVRKNRDVINVVLSTSSADGIDFTVKVIAITDVRCSESQTKALRSTLLKELNTMIKSKEFGEFILNVLYGRVSKELSEKLKKIVPIRRVEIRKTTLKEEFDAPAKEETNESSSEEKTKQEEKSGGQKN